MATILTPPTPIRLEPHLPGVFLAGSIEMGQAEPWQAGVVEELSDTAITILNPRRADWDATWAQDIAHPQFRAQVEWELEAQEKAALILMYFAPDTRAPITLLELGLFVHSRKLIVCCPAGFWRKGNVDIVCARYHIPSVPSLPALILAARQIIHSWSDQSRGHLSATP